MERGNVLVIGNSGVGKSTLINAVLGEGTAKTGAGTKGTTDKLSIHENGQIPFRIIDTVGFEPTFVKTQMAIAAVKKWSKECAKKGQADNQVNVIWFCVDGAARKLFSKSIQDLSKATRMWESVPVIVVITKSYSEPEREENIEMVNNAFAKQKRYSKNLRKVIPVVASTLAVNKDIFVAPDGIIELIDATNELMPEGIKAGQKDLNTYILNRKRALAHGAVGAATAAGVVVGAVPIPFSDALILSSIEIAEINALAHIYGISKNEESKKFFSSIVEVGTVSIAAKAAISALKAIPGVNLGASVINAVIAGSIVAALGEGTIYAFEQVYLGNKSVSDIDWVKKVIESKLSAQFINTVKDAVVRITETTDKKKIVKIIMDVFNNSSVSSDGQTE